MYAYLIILFLFAGLVTGLVLVGNETLLNSNAALDNDSIEYIAGLQGVNVSQYGTNKDEIEQSILINQNFSQGNPKDQGLELQFAKEKGSGFEVYIKSIISMPSVILFDLLRFDKGSWNWIISILNWLWRILNIIAIYYFARGVAT